MVRGMIVKEIWISVCKWFWSILCRCGNMRNEFVKSIKGNMGGFIFSKFFEVLK